MSDLIKEFFVEYWPMVASAFFGFIVSFFLYLKSRLSYKQKVIEKETENIALQKTIAEGSYILCPGCGSKIYLKDVRVFTGGNIENV